MVTGWCGGSGGAAGPGGGGAGCGVSVCAVAAVTPPHHWFRVTLSPCHVHVIDPCVCVVCVQR